MESRVGRQSFSVALVFGAMVFGMILAGGMDLTPTSSAQPTSAMDSGAVAVQPIAGLPSFADLVEVVSPAVVSIQVTTIEEGSSRRGSNPLEFFFGPRRRPQQPQQEQPRERRRDSSGSGFVISPDGYIVTNHHVIEDATGLMVALNGRQYPAEVKGDDPATDLALLKIEPDEELDYLRLADSDEVRVGDWVVVIGSPLQLANSVSVGVISAKGRSINITSDRSLENFIQTDAAINFGNSGGPLVGLDGSVIGIATAINYGAENIGFAVPSNTLRTILPQLRESGSVRRGYLGVNIRDLDHESAEAFGLDSPQGALVTEVVEGGPSMKAGLRYGDVILRVDGRPIADNRELIDYISSQPPGAKVKVDVFRNGKEIQKQIELGERPGSESAAVEPEGGEEESGIEWLGIRYQDLTPSNREIHGIPEDVEGVWITDVAPSSPLWDDNVRPNDFIIDVNGTPVTSVEEFEAAVDAVASGALLRLYLTRVDPRSGQSVSFFAIIRVP
ncbi:MAG: Do family serine endopeptidase [Thermoanaerobaculia bacterium]